MFNFKEIASITLILFSIIDILGSLPIVIEIRKREGHIHSLKATIISGVLMILFLFMGNSILQLFGLDVASFAVAGAIIIFILALEMILDINLFKFDPHTSATGSVIPLAFPLISGAGTLTTILSLRAVYEVPNILVGIVVNLIFVFIVLKSSGYLEKKLGPQGFSVLRRVFGIILLAIAVKILKDNLLL
ncbi:MAG: MarC family protein [Cyclobacteriaceae bacterium]|nr:MarC family protein [Cyclobacteriaceae bacterium]